MPGAVRQDARIDFSIGQSLELGGKVMFPVLTGTGGQAWIDAAAAGGAELDLDMAAHVAGPRQPQSDHVGEVARYPEMPETGFRLSGRSSMSVGVRLI